MSWIDLGLRIHQPIWRSFRRCRFAPAEVYFFGIPQPLIRSSIDRPSEALRLKLRSAAIVKLHMQVSRSWQRLLARANQLFSVFNSSNATGDAATNEAGWTTNDTLDIELNDGLLGSAFTHLSWSNFSFAFPV